MHRKSTEDLRELAATCQHLVRREHHGGRWVCHRGGRSGSGDCHHGRLPAGRGLVEFTVPYLRDYLQEHAARYDVPEAAGGGAG